MILAPSILSADFGILREQVLEVERTKADWLHIDVMDGMFVPNISFGAVVMQSIRPYSKLFFDVHLMIVNPERYLEDFIRAGADSITIHAEATDKIRECIDYIHSKGKKAGISINPETDVSVLEPWLSKVDMVLIMSVHPGHGGQSYIPEVNEKIRAIREKMGKDFLIQVDGGISAKNIREVSELGANVFVAGSAVFKGSISESVEKLFQAVGE